MFEGIGRDLVHAGRSLAKARAFTFVCVVSLGIGMAPVIAIPYVSRLTTLTPPGVNTEELVELVTTSVGPHQQTQQWSFPDYVDLRDANTGITLIGWIGGQSEVTFQATGGSKMRASTMFVPANYFKTLGVALARGAGFDASTDDPLRAEPVVVLNYTVLAEPSERRPRHRWQDAHDGWHSACRGGCCAGSIWWSPGVYRLGPLCSARTASAPSRPHRRRRRGELSRRPLEGVAEHSRPAVAWRQRSAGECRGCRGHRAVGQGVSGDQRVQGRDRRGIRPARHSPASATQNHSDGGAHAHRHGAARRLAEYLRHDAGSRRDA